MDKRLGNEADVEERVRLLIASTSLTLFDYVSSGLFERHKLLVATQLCMAILRRAGQLSAPKFEFLLRGPQVAGGTGAWSSCAGNLPVATAAHLWSFCPPVTPAACGRAGVRQGRALIEKNLLPVLTTPHSKPCHMPPASSLTLYPRVIHSCTRQAMGAPNPAPEWVSAPCWASVLALKVGAWAGGLGAGD